MAESTSSRSMAVSEKNNPGNSPGRKEALGKQPALEEAIEKQSVLEEDLEKQPARKQASGKLHLKRKRNNLRRKEALYGYLFISPWIVGFLFLFLRPLITSVQYAFSKVTFTPAGVTTSFVGLDNFFSPFRADAYFVPKTFAPGISSFWYEASLVCVFSLFIAMLLNQKFKGRAFARALFFLPVIIASGVVIQILRYNGLDTDLETENSFVFSSDGLSVLLNSIGFPAKIRQVFEEISNRIFDIVWLSGIQIILYLSGLQSIPRSEYEAAQIEGATAWECFWKITWVRVSPMTLVVVVYSIVDSFTNVSNKMIKFVTEGTTDMGVSCAMGWLMCVVALIVLTVVGGLISRHVFYVNEE